MALGWEKAGIAALLVIVFLIGGFVGAVWRTNYLCTQFPEEMDRIPTRYCFYD